MYRATKHQQNDRKCWKKFENSSVKTVAKQSTSSQTPLGSVMEFARSWQKIWTCAALLHHNNAPAHMSLKTAEFVTNNNMVTVPPPPYSLDLPPVISLWCPNWNWNWRDVVLKQCLTSKGNLKRYSTALRKMTSTLLFKCEKMTGSLYTFPRRLFWSCQPKLRKLS
jgi:hypothetical protein